MIVLLAALLTLPDRSLAELGPVPSHTLPVFLLRHGQDLAAHREVIGALRGHAQGVLGAERYPPRIANGSISVVELGETDPAKLILTNQAPPETEEPASPMLNPAAR